MFQYPDTDGEISIPFDLIKEARDKKLFDLFK